MEQKKVLEYAEKGELTKADYNMMSNELYEITNGYSNRIWFLKYYQMIAPNIFPAIYSDGTISDITDFFGFESGNGKYEKLWEIKDFINKANISNVEFNSVFWKYCVKKENENKSEEDNSDIDNRNCLDIVLEPISQSYLPLNIILYGAPGTGKTYSTCEYALSIIENRKADLSKKTHEQRKESIIKYKKLVGEGRIAFTTFHQSYSYEDFIQGLRPDKNSTELKFRDTDGVFKKIADTALNHGKDKYVIIIDEINRANISRVFGELITLIEEDKRWGELNEMCVTLPSGDVFTVPNNLYIIGTMNSADKSISLIDAALRRRFSFFEQSPDPSLIEDNMLKDIFIRINEILAERLESTDLLIGHSYFMNKSSEQFDSIMNNNIIPLLYEYFYDNRKRVKKVLEDILVNSSYEIYDNKTSRLRIRKK